MDRESNMKYIIDLNNDVTNEMLIEKGFIIEESKNFLWAVKRAAKNKKHDIEPRGTILIKLDPPERRIVFRYTKDDDEYDLLQEIEFMKGMFKVTYRWQKKNLNSILVNYSTNKKSFILRAILEVWRGILIGSCSLIKYISVRLNLVNQKARIISKPLCKSGGKIK